MFRVNYQNTFTYTYVLPCFRSRTQMCGMYFSRVSCVLVWYMKFRTEIAKHKNKLKVAKKAIKEGRLCGLGENQQLAESVGGIILASPAPITG